jgi:dephospho-CoA kinase
VTAPEYIRLARYIAQVTAGRPLLVEQRQALEEDGRRRIGMQIKDEDKIAFCDFAIENAGAMEKVEVQVSIFLRTCKRLRTLASDEHSWSITPTIIYCAVTR